MESIKSFQKFYPNNEYYLFFNQIDRKTLYRFEKLNLIIKDQNEFKFKINDKCKSQLKLIPSRVNINKQEIFIDNDLLITKRIEKIDYFIKSDNNTIICEDVKRFYGIFNKLIDENFCTNTGLFGLPSNFDFSVSNYYKTNNEWKSNYDEQGFLSLILLKHNPIIINLNEIAIMSHDFCSERAFNPIKSGYHFVGLNCKETHKSWNLFKTNTIKQI